MTKLVLVGNAITAEILYDYLRDDSRYDVVGVAVDDEFLTQGTLSGIESISLSRLREKFPPSDFSVLMAVGYNNLNRVRESLFLRIKAMGYSVERYIHPDARVYSRNPLGEGSIVLPSAVIEPHARVGANTMVWCNVTLAHHSQIDENCWIAAGTVVAGQARVSRNTFVGVNATIVDEVIVGENNIVGADALISKNTKPNTVHLARSAEPLRYSAEDYVKFFGI